MGAEISRQKNKKKQKIVYKYWDPPNNTRIKSIAYFNASGQYHRPWREGPAIIEYYDTPENRILHELYYENGVMHRPWREGPTSVRYYNTENNNIHQVLYCENDKLYRPHKEGPAVILYFNTPNNRVQSEEYWR